jgi:sugar lactone lactonase YvrE
MFGVAPSVTFDGVVSALSTGSVSLSGPAGVAVDRAGNVFIADTGNNQIVKIDSSGNAAVVAITGLSTALSSPAGVAVDDAGNLYIADKGNSRIVLASSSGAGSVVSTGAVTLSSPHGVALDASGNLFIADTGNSQIVEVASGGVASVYNITGLGTALAGPKGLAEDVAGNLYIADSTNNRIVKVTSGGAGSVPDLSGLVTALNGPSGVAVDAAGNIYIADPGNNRVVSVAALAGLATGSLTLTSPKGVAVDVFGSVYVAESGSNNRVDSIQISALNYGHKQLGTATGKNFVLPFTVQAGGALNTLGIYTMGYTFGVASTDFTAGTGGANPCVAMTYVSTTTCTIAIKFLPGAPGLAQGGMILTYTSGGVTKTVTVPLYGFADASQAALYPGTASKMNSGGVSLGTPYQIAVDGSGIMYVGDSSGNQVVKIPAAGGNATLVSAGSYAFGSVKGMALDGAGDLFIADSSNNKIIEITPAAASSQLTVTAASVAIASPTALAVDVAGNLFIADNGNSRVVKVKPPDVASATASLNGTVVSTGEYSFSGSTMSGLAVDGVDNLYIVDQTNSKVIKVTPAGAASEVVFADLTLSRPQGVAVDGMGNIYVADAGNNRIVQLAAAGTAYVVPIQGLTNPTTLGGDSTDLFGVTVDASGNIYIADSANSRVVKVNVSRASLAFASTKQGETSTDSPKTAMVMNLGNQALAFSANTSFTTSFSENTGDTNPCTASTTLSPGGVCDVSVNFTPQSVGNLSANVAVTNNALNVAGSHQQVAVSGTGITPGDTTAVAVTTNPTAVDAGEALTVTATVTDTAAGSSSTVPTGSVSFIDTLGSTAVSLNSGNAVALSAGVATLTGVTLSGWGTHTITANYGGVTGSFLASGNTTTVLVKAAPAVDLASSANPILVGSSVTFTATITAESGTPTGTVDFYDGSTLLGSGTSASGVATYATSSLTVGTHSITAAYSGDGQFSAFTSSAVSQVIADFTVAVGSGQSQSATVAPGGTATYHIAIGPSGGSTFLAAVTLSASGVPAGSTVTLNPTSLAAGASATDVTLAIHVPATAAALNQSSNWALGLALPLFGILVVPLGATLRRCGGKRSIRMCLLALPRVTAGAQPGSGGSTPKTTTTPRSYTVTVTATSGTVSHSTSVALTVQ